MMIPGIGPCSATALVAAVSEASAFKNGRQCAAWLGLVPRPHATGGKERLLGRSKRGDSYLRTGCEFCQWLEPLEVAGENCDMRGQCLRSGRAKQTRRSRACPPPTLPRSPTILLTAPRSYNAVALPLSPCETLRRYRKLATSSVLYSSNSL